ncbi:MAG: phosphodiester glycosidase family protein, partial [Opitutaceae bacterium]|nr:phosphodiester glycosidase family protein [Opitutaceae bacterium]
AGREAAPFFRDAQPGESIGIFWTLTGLPDGVRAEDVRDAVSGSTILIAAGRRAGGSGGFWETRHPRSAAGVDASGRRVVLVVADGRSQRSAGMNLTTLTDYLAHLGAHDALNFDGGGSSALVVRSEGRPQVLNRPSDGRERLIPSALGVVRAADGNSR